MRDFAIGDLHFFDDNIRRFEGRGWINVKQMNAGLIQSWNGVVTPEDRTFVFGDFFDFTNCTEDEAAEVLRRLNGEIVLIAGNHDMPYLDFYRKHGIKVFEYPIIYNNFWIFSHEPMYVNMNSPYANIFAHVHNNPMYNTVSPRSYCVSAERIMFRPILLSEVFQAVLQFNNK